MRRIRLLAAAFHRRFPQVGYEVALLVGGLLFLTPLDMTLGMVFVLIPALAGAGHLLAPSERRGGRPYWALAYAWLAAAALGLLAEWRALDPLTPWFSLARYLLCGGAVLGVAVSTVRGEPLFVRVEGLRSASAIRILVGVMQVVIVLGWLYLLAPDWTLRLALAPRHPGARIEILLSVCDTENSSLWAMSLSPDAQYVLLMGDDGVWAARADAPTAPARKVAGVFSVDSPWLPSGNAFYFSRKEEPGPYSLWLADTNGSRVEKIADDAARGTCSPNGMLIAYMNREGVWLANPDGSAPRLLLPRGTSVSWSPDGQRLLCTGPRRPPQRPERFVAGVDGSVRRLEIPDDHGRIMWLGPTHLLTTSERKRGVLTGTRLLPEACAHIWTLDGKEERAFGLGTSGSAEVFPSPDGQKLAFGASLPSIFDLCQSVQRATTEAPTIKYDLFLMDLVTGRVTRLPTPGGVFHGDWSADGRTLLVNGTETVRDGRESEVAIRSTLALVSGM